MGKKGQGLDVDGVQNVTVKTTVFTGAKNGFRIKTWSTKSRGYVKNVAFVDAMMRNVENPIIIDQHYCPDDDGCPSKVRAEFVKRFKFVIYTISNSVFLVSKLSRALVLASRLVT